MTGSIFGMVGSVFRTLKERKQWEKPANEADVIGAAGKKTFPTAYPEYPSPEIARLQADFKWGGFGTIPYQGELVLREDRIHFAMYSNEMAHVHSFSGQSKGDIQRAMKTMMRWSVELRDLEDIEIDSGGLQTKVTVQSALGDSGPNGATRVFTGIVKADWAREFRRLALEAKAALPPPGNDTPPPLETFTNKMVPFFEVFRGPCAKDSVDVLFTGSQEEGLWAARCFTMCDGKGHVTRFTYYIIPVEPLKPILFLYLGEENGKAISRLNASVNESNAKVFGQTWPKLARAWGNGQKEIFSDHKVPALRETDTPTHEQDVWGLAIQLDGIRAEHLYDIDPDGIDRPDVIEKAQAMGGYALEMLVEWEENDPPKTFCEAFAEAYSMWRTRSNAMKLASFLGNVFGIGGH